MIPCGWLQLDRRMVCGRMFRGLPLGPVVFRLSSAPCETWRPTVTRAVFGSGWPILYLIHSGRTDASSRGLHKAGRVVGWRGKERRRAIESRLMASMAVSLVRFRDGPADRERAGGHVVYPVNFVFMNSVLNVSRMPSSLPRQRDESEASRRVSSSIQRCTVVAPADGILLDASAAPAVRLLSARSLSPRPPPPRWCVRAALRPAAVLPRRERPLHS
jgi:hypothetical protein